MNWYARYIGKPWARVPNPPESYTCGELVRSVFRDELGIESAEIQADPIVYTQCVRAMEPERFGLVPTSEPTQEFDVVFLQRSSYKDHVGILFNSVEGWMVLHCMQGAGVIADMPSELRGSGYTLTRYRHKDLLNV